VGEEVRDDDGYGCAAAGLVQLVVVVIDVRGLGFQRGFRWCELRQLRLGVVIVDRRLYRIAVIVVIRR
jgi:hypothetical protein